MAVVRKHSTSPQFGQPVAPHAPAVRRVSRASTAGSAHAFSVPTARNGQACISPSRAAKAQHPPGPTSATLPAMPAFMSAQQPNSRPRPSWLDEMQESQENLEHDSTPSPRNMCGQDTSSTTVRPTFMSKSTLVRKPISKVGTNGKSQLQQRQQQQHQQQQQPQRQQQRQQQH
eukprot:TRINITY_DN5310_c1_g1_i1.p1 TRINITY_DN5310_c1_g1~~TRINITY_DN5310_c1_g1_i1.p1  ORF type:complete len:189 (-),score=48.19 TRINITY_DN5310_c1_g1_i1:29-547(-)